MTKDGEGNILTSEENVTRRWKEYFEEQMHIEHVRERRLEEVEIVHQVERGISREEERTGKKRMKGGKAVGPDSIPVDAWRILEKLVVTWLTRLFNKFLVGEKMPEKWRKSVLVPIFKNKGDVQSGSSYRGKKLISYAMKTWERVVEARLGREVRISEEQYGFVPGRGTTDAIFALRMLMEKSREGQKELHCVFVDLEKVYERAPRSWHCMRKSGMAERYVKVMTLSYVVRAGRNLRRSWEDEDMHWREEGNVKVSRNKVKYMYANGRNGGETVRLQGVGVAKVKEFKCLGSTVQRNGEWGREGKKRVQAGWSGRRRVTRVICDGRMSARMKRKVYKTAVRPTMLCGMETVPLTRRQKTELEVAELMLRFSFGVTKWVMGEGEEDADRCGDP
nr:uncharacterized protein LOC113815833 [Penaeus vannamei]